MTLLGYIYGGLGAVALGVALTDLCIKRTERSDPSAVLAALGLCLLWATYNSIKVLHLPESFAIFAPMDLIALVLVVALYRLRKAYWKVVLAFAFLAQLCLHVVFAFLSDQSAITQWRYSTGLDVFYVIQLLAIASSGVGRGLRYLRDLPDSRRAASKAMVR